VTVVCKLELSLNISSDAVNCHCLPVCICMKKLLSFKGIIWFYFKVMFFM